MKKNLLMYFIGILKIELDKKMYFIILLQSMLILTTTSAIYYTKRHKEEIHGHIFNNKILYTQYSLV